MDERELTEEECLEAICKYSNGKFFNPVETEHYILMVMTPLARVMLGNYKEDPIEVYREIRNKGLLE